MIKHSIRLVISDMDGTLIDSEGAIAQASAEALVDWGITCSPAEFKPFTGLGDNKFIAGVSEKYGVPYTYLESWIESIAYVRNLCAHYGRLYNAKLTKTPILYREYRKQDIKNNRVFGVLCCLKHLLPNDRHWTEFVDQIELLFEKYTHVKKETMGFVENWREILLR